MDSINTVSAILNESDVKTSKVITKTVPVVASASPSQKVSIDDPNFFNSQLYKELTFKEIVKFISSNDDFDYSTTPYVVIDGSLVIKFSTMYHFREMIGTVAKTIMMSGAVNNSNDAVLLADMFFTGIHKASKLLSLTVDELVFNSLQSRIGVIFVKGAKAEDSIKYYNIPADSQDGLIIESESLLGLEGGEGVLPFQKKYDIGSILANYPLAIAAEEKFYNYSKLIFKGVDPSKAPSDVKYLFLTLVDVLRATGKSLPECKAITALFFKELSAPDDIPSLSFARSFDQRLSDDLPKDIKFFLPTSTCFELDGDGKMQFKTEVNQITGLSAGYATGLIVEALTEVGNDYIILPNFTPLTMQDVNMALRLNGDSVDASLRDQFTAERV
jgi:hypothetical protein